MRKSSGKIKITNKLENTTVEWYHLVQNDEGEDDRNESYTKLEL